MKLNMESRTYYILKSFENFSDVIYYPRTFLKENNVDLRLVGTLSDSFFIKLRNYFMSLSDVDSIARFPWNISKKNSDERYR